MTNQKRMWILITALTCTNTSALADWCSNNSDDLDYVQSWYNDYYTAFENNEVTYNEFKLSGMDDPTCTSWDVYDSDGNPRYNAHCTDWDDESLAGDACAKKFVVNSSDYNSCWRVLTGRDECEGGSGGGAGSGESCGIYVAMNGDYYEQSADTCYVPSTEYFFTSQGHKYHFKSNCWWSS